MGIVLISLLIIALLVLLVLGLHRYQLSATQSNADSHGPLPPLDDVSFTRNLPDLTLNDDAGQGISVVIPEGTPEREPEVGSQVGAKHEPPHRPATTTAVLNNGELNTPDASLPETDSVNCSPDSPQQVDPETETTVTGGQVPGDTGSQHSRIADAVTVIDTDRGDSASVSDPEADPETTVGDRPVRHQSVPGDAPEVIEITEVTLPAKGQEEPDHWASPDADNWLEQVANLKKHNQLDEALAICHQVFPLWSAYQQATLIHRARIKRQLKNQQDPEAELKTLYRLAAQASFLHDRVKGLPDLSLAQLKTLNLSVIEELEMPYASIGYSELRLVKKTDIKLLQDKFGKPEQHLKPREFYAETWQKLASSQQTTLF